MSKIDYELKSKVLNSSIYSDYKNVRNIQYRYIYLDNVVSDTIYKLNNELGLIHSRDSPKEWIECSKIYSAHKNRVRRLKGRVQSMLSDNKECLFLTLTFTDNSLNKLSAVVRKKYVQDFLRSLGCRYIANIDFGKKNHREHYHPLVETGLIDYHLWKYGSINGQKVRNTIEDSTRLSKYVAKLTNHAIKETTQRCAIIYSKSNWEV